MSKNHKHHGDDLSRVQRAARAEKREVEMGSWFKVPANITTIFRPLLTPADSERNSPPLWMQYQAHENIGPNKRFGMCGNKPGESGNCWLCKKRAKLEKNRRTKEAAKLAPVRKMLFQSAVMDRDTDELVGPIAWEVRKAKKASHLWYKLLNLFSNDRIKKYLDPKHGYNFRIKRIGEGLKTEYGELIREDESSRVPSEIIKRLRPFADLNLRKYDEEWLKKAYYGREDDKENDSDMPSKSKKKSKKHEASSSDDDASEEESSEQNDSSEEDDGSEENDSSDQDSSDKEDNDSSEEDDSSDNDSSDKEEDDSSDQDSSDKEEDDSSEEDASDKKSKKKKSKKKSKKSKDSSDDDSSDESSDEESSDKEEDDSSEEDSSDKEEDDSSEEDASDKKPSKKKGKGKAKPKAKAKGKAKGKGKGRR